MSNRSVTIFAVLALLLPVALPLVPSAAAAAAGTGPTFAVFPHPTSAGDFAGEPTLGINHATGAILFQDGATTWRIDTNLAANPPSATWTAVTPPNSVTNIDPMLFTDLGTGRTFAGGLDGECSIMSYTDNDGESWMPVGNQCAGAFDHQTIGQGPWLEPRPELASYDRATYYCAQGWANWPTNACVTSWDGGLVYTPPVNWAGPCFGLHGHVNVSADGRAYVPTRSCAGVAGYAWTDDNGASWGSKKHPAGYAAPSTGFDSSIGASIDGDTLWFAFERNDWVPMVSRSTDDGNTWEAPVAVGEDLGIKTATFLRVMSGDPDRAVLVYLGSTTDGNPFVNTWRGVWDLYASYTYDAGATWSTVKITDDPVQRGWMCAGGFGCSAGRNLLDFIGSTLDPEGNVLIAFADGCVGACAGPLGTSSQSTAAWSTVARQLTGKGLFAAHDRASVDIGGPLVGLAGAPVSLTATVNAELPYGATVSWGDGVVETTDGLVSTAFAASHAYAAAGSYPISLTIVGNDGASATGTTQATIGSTTGGAIEITSPGAGDTVGELVTVSGIVSASSNTAPIAAFSFTLSGAEATFDATASSDPDGDTLVFSWLFGDGATGVGAAPVHTYGSPGTYEVALTVGDGQLTSELRRQVTIAMSGATLVADDDAGDAPGLSGANIEDLDILKVEGLQNAAGEPVFIVTYATLGSPSPPLTEAGTGKYYRLEWTGPQGTDFVSYATGLSSGVCEYGTLEGTTLTPTGPAQCTVTEGTPGKLTIAYPAAGLSARGYTGGDTLGALVASTGIVRGTPHDGGVCCAQSFLRVDSTTPSEYTLAAGGVWASLGLPAVSAAKPAPTTPPSDPEVTDKTSDPVGDNVPTTNIQSAWFDADADNLYVGMKVQDIPADPTTTAFISYAVNFNPTWEVADPSWNGSVTATMTGLRAFALYSPARLGSDGLPSSDTATRFELQSLSADATGSYFGSVAFVDGSIDPTTDIVWWIIPRATLQSPPGGAVLEKTSAASVPAVGGLLTMGTLYGDSTGDGEDYAFPQQQVVPPTVTLSADVSAGDAPLAVTFTGTVTPAAVSTWTLTFGDQTQVGGSGALPASFAPHVYTAAGTYTARLTVVAPDGGIGVAQTSVQVSAVQSSLQVLVQAGGGTPVLATCTSGCAEWTADLDLAGVAPGDVTITATLAENGETLATDSIVVLLQRQAGVVIDAPLDGATVTTGDVLVSGRLAAVNDARPMALLALDRDQGLAPLDVTFSMDGDDDNGIVSWTLLPGDSSPAITGSALPAQASHTYASPGTYTVLFTVRDARGQTDDVQAVVRVAAENTPPSVPTAPTPADGATGVALPVVLTWDATDPDGDALTFDVYIDGVLVGDDQTGSFMPGGLAYATTYAWQVVASDGTASTSGPLWTFTTGARPLTEADKPHVVVAVIDTGGNPYHMEWRRAHLTENPSTYVTGMPANVEKLDLCFYNNATSTLDQSRCPATVAGAWSADASQWSKLSVSPLGAVGAGAGDVAWVAGTNLLLASFGHTVVSGSPVGVDAGSDSLDSHGSWTSSNVGGLTTGTCPECLVVVIEADTVDGIKAAYNWAANQPWIDVVTSSVSIGLVGLGANPADAFAASSAATKTAVQKGKIVFEAAGNGAGNLGVAPTSTYLYANSNPWTIPVGCSAEFSGQPCAYHDSPNPVTASGVSRVSTSPKSWSGTEGVGGTSFSSPSTAGVAARTLLAVRTAMNDLTEGPSTGAGKSLVRIGAGATAPATGPLANGILTKLELEETLFKTARRDTLPKFPTYVIPLEVVHSPASVVKEGYGNVYRGDWGVNGPGAAATWSSSADAASVILGEKDLPNRWVEEFYWEAVIDPTFVALFGADVPETDADAFPRNDPVDPDATSGYQGPAATSTRLPSLSATVVPGDVPTPENGRMYLHHNDLGPDPGSPTNSVYEFYVNSIADPAGGAPTCSGVDCPDRSGVGATGINPLGSYSMVYTVKHPTLGGPVTLDRTKDITVRVVAKGYGASASGTSVNAPPSPATLTVRLLSGDVPVGSGVAARVLNGQTGAYEVKFKPSVDALVDTTELVLEWAGPAYSMHVLTRGQSWIDLPVAGTLPPVAEVPVTYYVDDFATAFSASGDTVTLTRDRARLAGDADKGSFYYVPQPDGLLINLVAEDDLATKPTLLAGSGSLLAYPCTAPFIDLGAAQITVAVTLSVAGTVIGSGSLTTELVGINEGYQTAVAVPIAFKPVLVPQGAPLEGTIRMYGPGGVFYENTGVCGGGETHPIALTLATLPMDAAPTVTLGELPDPLAGQVTLTGTGAFPAVPGVAAVQWHAKDLDQWTANGQTLAMDTTGPGTASAAFFEPTPDGVTLTLRSARPAVDDIGAIATDGAGRLQFWASPLVGVRDLTVAATVYLADADGPERVVGTASLTKTRTSDPLALETWPDASFDMSFVPQVTTPEPGEHLYVRFHISNANGHFLASNTFFFGGDAAQPIFVELPRDVDTNAVAPEVEVELGALLATVPVVDGAWTLGVDTRQLTNGAKTLTVTPRATYGGEARTGTSLVRQVTIENIQVNTPPTATLALAPTAGAAPLLVTAALGGNDAQTPRGLLSWSIDWGDGSAATTGLGLPAAPTHTYAAGTHTATLTVTDAGGMLATAQASVTAAYVPPVEKVVLLLDGANAVDAVDDSGDGSFGAWHALVNIGTAGTHGLTARHVRGAETVSEASIILNVQLPDVPEIVITSHEPFARVPAGASLQGTASYTDTINAVEASLDAGFATTVAATTTNGYATWSVPLDALGLTEDQMTLVFVRALAASADGPGHDSTLLARDQAPNADIAFLDAMPQPTLVDVGMQSASTPSATGAAITGYAWTFGDGGSDTAASVTHAYARSGTYTVTLTVTDANGETGTATRAATITNRLPVATLGVSHPAPTPLDTVTITAAATDADGTVAAIETIAYAGSTRASDVLATGGTTLSLQFPDDGSYLLVARATDDEGGVGETEQLLVVFNARPLAVIAAPARVGTGAEFVLDAAGSSDPDGTLVEYAFDLGDGTRITQPEAQLAHVYETAGTYTATVTVTDDDGSVITSDPISIVANARPVLDAIGNKVVAEQETLSFTATATDAENDPLTWSIDTVPSGASFDTSTGAFQWTPTLQQSGNYPVTISVTDGLSSDSEAFIISVGDVDLPPALDAIGDRAGRETDLLTFVVTATDADTSILTYSMTGDLPPAATLGANTGVFTWTPGYADAGIYTVTFSVTDGTTTDSETIAITIANVDRAPTLQPIAPGTLKQLSTIAIPVTATDPDGDILSFAILSGPDGATVRDDGAGHATLLWTPTINHLGAYTVDVVATSGALAATRTTTITVLFNTSMALSPVVGTVKASPNQAASTDALLVNTGPQPDTFTLSATNDAGWALSQVPADITLAPGETYRVALTTTVPTGGAASITTITARSLGDGTTTKLARVRIEVPVVITIEVDTAADLLDLPSGSITVTYLDGTPAAGATVTVTQTPQYGGTTARSAASGTSDAQGIYTWDFSRDPRGLVPGKHALLVSANIPGGVPTLATGEYRVGA